MDTLTVVLTALLGSGGVAGVVALLRLRVDKGSVVVDTVSKGVLVLGQLNDRLEDDLAEERTARIAAETEARHLRRQLDRCTCGAADSAP